MNGIDQVIDQVEPAIFLFKDFHPFLTRNNFAVMRKLKEIALHLKNSYKTIVLVSPVMEIPAELEWVEALVHGRPLGALGGRQLALRVDIGAVRLNAEALGPVGQAVDV